MNIESLTIENYWQYAREVELRTTAANVHSVKSSLNSIMADIELLSKLKGVSRFKCYERISEGINIILKGQVLSGGFKGRISYR